MKKREEPRVDAALAAAHGLVAEEYERLVKLLGRTPTWTELGITSALWSEHCSYKSSKVHLREFPTSGPHVVQGPGENAGVVDIGHGWVAVFKIESHNHPSFLEPYQGAATGVGGGTGSAGGAEPPQAGSRAAASRATARVAWARRVMAGPPAGPSCGPRR